MKPSTTIAVAWVVTASCVAYGLYLTHSAGCLWALFIPLFLDITKE